MTIRREFKTSLTTWPDGETAPMLIVGVQDRELAPGPDSWARFGFIAQPEWREVRPPLMVARDVVVDVSGAPAFLLGGVQVLRLDSASLGTNWLQTVRSTRVCIVGLNLNSNPHLAWADVRSGQRA